MKAAYIFLVGATVFCLRCVEPAKSTYNRDLDLQMATDKSMFLPPIFLTFFVSSGKYIARASSTFDVIEFLWTFSIIMESVAMLPQLRLFQHNRDILNTPVRLAIAMRGLYRFCYILNWIHRTRTEPYFVHHYVVYISAVVQVSTYTDFFIYHIRHGLRRSQQQLQQQVESVDDASQTKSLLEASTGGGEPATEDCEQPSVALSSSSSSVPFDPKSALEDRSDVAAH